MLIEAGALLDLKNKQGDTALMIPFYLFKASAANSEVVKMLIVAGANPYIKNKQGITVFDLATDEKKTMLEEAIAERDKIRAAKNPDVRQHLAVPGLADLVLDYDIAHPVRAPQEAGPAEVEND